MQRSTFGKSDKEVLEEIISILKESDIYSELSAEEKEELISIVLSA